jgi:two-component system response regulator FixJ
MAEGGAVVCIVDDDAAVRGALKFSLELEGIKVRLYDGPGALLADSDLPKRGCLVIDYRMPGMNGLELIEMLRARHVRLPAIIITGITGRANRELRQRASAAEIRGILEKPLADSGLIEAVRSAMAVAG